MYVTLTWVALDRGGPTACSLMQSGGGSDGDWRHHRAVSRYYIRSTDNHCKGVQTVSQTYLAEVTSQ